MTSGEISPTLDGFRELARKRRVVPVVRRLMADAETPVGLYRKLSGGRPGSFLLESAEHGGVWSRYSIVGARSHAVLTENDGEAAWVGGDPPHGVPRTGNPLAVLAETLEVLKTPALPGLPPLTGGLVGYLAYDAVREWERLPDKAVDELAVPVLGMMLATDLAVLDHSDGSVLLIANAINYDASDERVDEAWSDAVARLDSMTADLRRPADSTVASLDPDVTPQYASRTDHATFIESVAAAKEAIAAGECFQIVVSQRFEMQCPADSLDVYRVLRATNPSPYMYLLRFSDFDIVGSSPEALVKVAGGQAMEHPIAGTRWRGETPEADAALAAELLEDDKERAEHLMLVDLARNDLGRVCDPGTVEVVDFMSVERYSHVMHIVSTVLGQVSPSKSAYDVLAATFPAGTLSGAPKVRAMELIEEMEPARRGVYGGTVGYFDFAGDMDMAIAIRTALIRDGVAYVQAGGGIVADSDPQAEFQESVNKAAAVLQAVATAATLRPLTETVQISRRSSVEDKPQSRRGLLLSALGLAVSGVLLLLAARLQRSEALGDTQANASLLQAIGWLLLAAVAALVAATGWVRRVLGVVICGAGVAAAASVGSAMVSGRQSELLWIAACWIASAVALVTGVVVVARGGRWPGWSRRFDPARDSRPADPVDQWRALDRGEDPTR